MASGVERSDPVTARSLDPWMAVSHEPRPEATYLANGYLGLSVPWHSGLASTTPAPFLVRGVYSPGPDGIDHLAAIPSCLGLRYGCEASPAGYERRLDFRRGILTTIMDLVEERGTVRLVHELFLSRADRHLAVASLTVTPAFEGEITVSFSLDTAALDDFGTHEVEADGDILRFQGRVEAYGIEVSEEVRVLGEGWKRQGGHTAPRFTRHAGAGCEHTISLIARLETSLDDVTENSTDWPEVPEARRVHERTWDDLWQTDIEIEGDPEVQQCAHAALFYLWSTMAPGERWSIAPMGLSSNVYNGHIFWDAELWMFPALLLTHPDLAAPCVAYRSHTLPAAERRARAGGYDGAQFPWEGGFTGDEMTPFWASTRDFQIHVTADVAIAQWLYYCNTLDLDWLRDHGFPVIRRCADFWMSRVERKGGRFEISDVVCADEYAEHVNNDAFTNAAVAVSLGIATRAARLVGEAAEPEWDEIAAEMYVPYDGNRRVHLEYDGYDHRTTKQADVELLAYPLRFVTGDEQVARDLDFYAGAIDPDGPAMSFSIYAILAAQLGRAEEAYRYLLRSFMPNIRRPFWSFSETPTNNDFFFCTGIGGAIQALLHAFTGLRLDEGAFALRPLLPPGWNALRLRNVFLAGARTDIEIERDRLLVRRHGSRPVALSLTCSTSRIERIEVREGEGLTIEVEAEGGTPASRENARAGDTIEIPGAIGSARVRGRQDGHTVLDFTYQLARSAP